MKRVLNFALAWDGLGLNVKFFFGSYMLVRNTKEALIGMMIKWIDFNQIQ